MFIDLIRKRRSIRRFKADQIEAEKIAILTEAALRAPSSRGANPWEFVFVTDGDLLKKLSRAKAHGSAFMANAQLGVIVCADPEKSDVWVEDAAIAAIFIQLAVESLGLGSCWIQIRKRMHDDSQSAEEYIAQLLNIPSGLKVASMIAVGYPAEIKRPHAREALQDEKVYMNHYGVPISA